MRKRRRSWLLAVHRWLFYFAFVVVIGSALSRIDDDSSGRRVFASRSQPAQGAADHNRHAHRDDVDEDDGGPFVAFAACP
jgi:hypothetical protein